MGGKTDWIGNRKRVTKGTLLDVQSAVNVSLDECHNAVTNHNSHAK